jgi:sugar phosphate isomerase/epimerase
VRLSCADNTFRLVQPWENALAIVHLLELPAVDVCLMGNRSHLRPEEVRNDVPGTARRVTDGLAGQGLACSDVFCIPWTDFERYAPNHPDPAERERAWALFDDVLELAAKIEAPGLTLLPGIDWPGESHADSFARSVEELGRRAERARERGVRFSIEPHLGSVVQDPREAKRLCEEAPGVELTLDYSHFVYQGYGEDAIEPLVPHARHFHARGAAPRRMQTALRENEIDFERLVRVAQEAGFDGDIGLEYLWIDWEGLNTCDTVSETILLRDRLLAAIEGRPWSYPVSSI